MPAGNAKPVFETPLMTAKNPKPRLTEIDVAIKNAKEMYLVASDQGAISCDWASWIEPRLILADGKSIDLTTLKWKGEERGYGRTQIGKNNGVVGQAD